jgi:hypothetical protein
VATSNGSDEELPHVPFDELLECVWHLAAAATLLHRWPEKGRNPASFALLNVLMRNGWSGRKACDFVLAIDNATPVMLCVKQ